VARALIVGCGCRGRELGGALREAGWQVRGTTRRETSKKAIAEAGIEPAVADPLVAGTVFDLIEGVAIVYWLMGSAEGEPGDAAEVNGERLESFLEKLVDTPVRGFVYEAAGRAAPNERAEGARLVRAASERWRIPVEVVEADPADFPSWRAEMLDAGRRALMQR
jgi:nucleoside-diphosphate-sugar epimerase